HNAAELKGHTLALADPASTSGSLFPLYAMIHAGLNPKSDVHLEYAGSHTASMLALTHGKVDAAEVNSQQQAVGQESGDFLPSNYRRIWVSAPIVNDPITVRSDLPTAFKTALASALLKLTPDQLKLVDTELGVNSWPMIAAQDSFYTPIRSVAKSEHLDFSSI